jgi:hypothetical protein
MWILDIKPNHVDVAQVDGKINVDLVRKEKA